MLRHARKRTSDSVRHKTIAALSFNESITYEDTNPSGNSGSNPSGNPSRLAKKHVKRDVDTSLETQVFGGEILLGLDDRLEKRSKKLKV